MLSFIDLLVKFVFVLYLCKQYVITKYDNVATITNTKT